MLKRSEEAYLEWGTARDQKGIMTIPNDFDGFLAGYDAGKAAALEWAAGQVESTGCACKTLCIDHDWDGEFNGTLYYTKPGGPLIDGRTSVARHDRRCPVALAAKIRAGAP